VYFVFQSFEGCECNQDAKRFVIVVIGSMFNLAYGAFHASQQGCIQCTMVRKAHPTQPWLAATTGGFSFA